MICADLHMHSTASDGILPAEAIVQHARQAGLSAIAVTDHDTVAGSKRACACASELMVVPGVEITTQTEGRHVHMLGYFIDLDDTRLDEFFAENRHRREDRACAIADNLASDGFAVSADAMRKTGKTLNRSLLARMLVESGAATSIDDAFKRLIGYMSPYYVSCAYPSTVDAIRLINGAGGCAFIAHPAQYHVVDLIERFARESMTGLEAYHTMQSRADSELLVKLASRLGLSVSGGSDWHGDATHGASLASAGLERAQLEAFLRACGRADMA